MDSANTAVVPSSNGNRLDKFRPFIVRWRDERRNWNRFHPVRREWRCSGSQRASARLLALTQQEARLELDKKDLQAQMIQWMEDFEAITGVCSFRRFSRPKLDGESFCEAYPTEAAACSAERKAYVRWTIYASRSY
jgi:hypothetical protein